MGAQPDEAGPVAPRAPDRERRRGSLLGDALLTIGARIALAGLILGTDVVLARLLGPDAKGRFALVILLSQLAAVVVGWGMDSAIGVVTGRGGEDARRGFATALLWTVVAGGLAAVAVAWLYGLPADGRPRGPLAVVVPNLSADQFTFAALAIPGELFFALGLSALLGRRRVAAYNTIRVLRRATLLALVVAAAAIARLSLGVALVCNLAALAITIVAIVRASRSAGIASSRPSLPILGEELRFGTRAVAGVLAERLQFRADAFLLNLLTGVRATGVYSVTAGLAETLWYVPNALGTVMFSRAVDPRADAAGVAVVLTRTTVAITVAFAVPAFLLGPWLVELVYGAAFAQAGVALRWILPGVVAYSVVAVLSRYVTGRGRPGAATLVLVAGLVANVTANLMLIPAMGIAGAALASSLSYGLTAALMLAVFLHLSGRTVTETLLVRRTDLAGASRSVRAWAGRRLPGVPPEPEPTAFEEALAIAEHDPRDEP